MATPAAASEEPPGPLATFSSPPVVTGTVVDGDSVSVAHADISVFGDEALTDAIGWATTKSDGSFTVEYFSQPALTSPQWLIASHPLYESVEQRTITNDAETDVGTLRLTERYVPRIRPNSAIQDLDYCLANYVPRSDDGSSGEVELPFPMNFYGRSHQSLSVNNNGYVTFGPATWPPSYPIYSPQPFTEIERPIIAPFLADIDTRSRGSRVVTYGASPDTNTFCVNWVDVGYYDSRNSAFNGYGLTTALNSFQLIIRRGIDGRPAGDFDLTFNYDRIDWETGDASYGVAGLGGTSAAVGYTAGTGARDSYFDLPGSLVNGAFLDGGAQSLIAGSRGSDIAGRYVFEFRDGAGPLTRGGLGGTVTDGGGDGIAGAAGAGGDGAGGDGIAGAAVDACLTRADWCAQATTASDGSWAIATLPTGPYTITVYPPADAGSYRPGHGSATVVADTTTAVSIQLTAPRPAPAGVSFGAAGGAGGAGGTGEPPTDSGGVPTVYWDERTVLFVPIPSGAERANFTLAFDNGPYRSSGNMVHSNGMFTVPLSPFKPAHGPAAVTVTFTDGSGGSVPAAAVEFDIYIDPGGTVIDADGQPVSDATVTLYRADRADRAGGPYTPVPEGSANMSPSNRANPDTTDARGRFGWEVMSSYYKVTARKGDCTAESATMEIPPDVAGLQLTLTCPRPGGGGPVTDGGPVAGAQFSDIPEGSPFAADISWLAEQGITQGYPDGTFKPNSTLSRGEIAAFLHRASAGSAGR